MKFAVLPCSDSHNVNAMETVLYLTFWEVSFFFFFFNLFG